MSDYLELARWLVAAMPGDAPPAQQQRATLAQHPDRWVARAACRRCGAALPPEAFALAGALVVECASCGEAHAARRERVN